MNKYHKWALLASGVAAVLLAWAIAFAVLGVYETDQRGELALERSKVEDLQIQLSHAGDTIDRLDNQLQTQKTLSAPVGMEYLGQFMCTAYCVEPYDHICGTGDGITAAGTEATPGRTIAADWSILPPGSVVYIVGVGVRTVEDKGTAVTGKQLDISVAMHSEALTWPAYGPHDVYLIEGEAE